MVGSFTARQDYFTTTCLIKYKHMAVTTVKIIILCMFGDTNPNILASLLSFQIINLENQKRFLK